MKYLIALLSGVALLSYSSFATAQTATPSAAAAEPTGLSDVIVTATRRRENLQKVPLAVQAVSGNQLAARHLMTTTDIQFAAPSVTFATGPSPSGQGFTIRGVGTIGFAPSVEQSVGVVVDGVVMGTPGAGITEMVDIGQVEILRGPQGMLFGKNASAGLISINSNSPVLNQFQGQLHVSYGSYNDRVASGVINIPLGETAAIRLSGIDDNRDGIQTNLTDGQKFNDNDEYFLRGRFRWQPTDKLRIDVSADYDKSNDSCCDSSLIVGDLTNVNVRADIAAGERPGPNNIDAVLTPPFPFTTKTDYGGSVELNYDFGPATLTSQTALREYYNNMSIDADFAAAPITEDHLLNNMNQYSQEFRLTSNQALFTRVDYVLGVFLYHAELGRDQYLIGAANSQNSDPVDSKSAAGFGELTVHATDQLRLILGGRYTSDSVHQGDLTGKATGPVTLRDAGTAKATNFSYKAGVQYDFPADVNAFATVTRGYKGPAFSEIPAATAGPAPTPIAVMPELSTEYSAGLRSQLWDHRVTLNITVYQQDFTNYQATTFDPATFTSFLRNAGSAQTRGVELESDFRPTPEWTFTENAGLGDPKFTNFTGVACSAVYIKNFPAACPGGVINATGQALVDAPQFTSNTVVAYERSVGEDLILNLQGSYTYRSKVNFMPYDDPYFRQAGYGLLNFNFSLGRPDNRWKVSVYGRNILGQMFSSGMQTVPGAIGASVNRNVTIEAFRTFGVAFDLQFGS